MGMSAPVTRWRRPLSRRELLAAGLVVMAAPSEADKPAANPNKIPQADAQYQPMPKGLFSCAVCSFFIKPKSCKVVDGEISPIGWCKLFDVVD